MTKFRMRCEVKVWFLFLKVGNINGRGQNPKIYRLKQNDLFARSTGNTVRHGLAGRQRPGTGMDPKGPGYILGRLPYARKAKGKCIYSI